MQNCNILFNLLLSCLLASITDTNTRSINDEQLIKKDIITSIKRLNEANQDQQTYFDIMFANNQQVDDSKACKGEMCFENKTHASHENNLIKDKLNHKHQDEINNKDNVLRHIKSKIFKTDKKDGVNKTNSKYNLKSKTDELSDDFISEHSNKIQMNFNRPNMEDLSFEDEAHVTGLSYDMNNDDQSNFNQSSEGNGRQDVDQQSFDTVKESLPINKTDIFKSEERNVKDNANKNNIGKVDESETLNYNKIKRDKIADKTDLYKVRKSNKSKIDRDQDRRLLTNSFLENLQDKSILGKFEDKQNLEEEYPRKVPRIKKSDSRLKVRRKPPKDERVNYKTVDAVVYDEPGENKGLPPDMTMKHEKRIRFFSKIGENTEEENSKIRNKRKKRKNENNKRIRHRLSHKNSFIQPKNKPHHQDNRQNIRNTQHSPEFNEQNENIINTRETSDEEKKSKKWTYDGRINPDAWPLYYSKCNGPSQSPINIITSKTISKLYKGLTFVNYAVSPKNVVLTNNGKYVEANFEYSFMPTIKDGGLFGKFQFQSLQFHWGGNSNIGSEHSIDGIKFPLEVHFIHWNTLYPSTEEALQHPDGVAILAILFHISESDNIDYANIISTLRRVKNAGKSADVANPTSLEGYLPEDIDHFYRYFGSLTSPPCDEAVTWTVFKNTLGISSRQMAEFRHLTQYNDDVLTNNFRPVQPLNNRKVKERKSIRSPVRFSIQSAITKDAWVTSEL